MSTAANLVGLGSTSSEPNRAKGEFASESEQARLRQEATYRQDRGMLMSAIGDYYGKQGWAIPTGAAPGAGTSSPLPGDAPLYPNYNIPASPWDYQQKPPVAGAPAPAADQTGQVQPTAPVQAGVAQGAQSVTANQQQQASSAPVANIKPIALVGDTEKTGAPQDNLKLLVQKLGGSYGY